LVSDLLESERLASPHVALQREPVDLAALIRDLVQQLPGTPLIQLDLDAALSTQALDAARIRLLVRNLLGNALRHNPPQAQAPVLSLAAAASGGVELRVRDFGPGVAPGDIPQLGQPFFRPDTARTREGGGVGLGLYLCRLVAQAHGGSFTVRNAQPGLEVCVWLPSPAPQDASKSL
jgi:signal transduction histidine kinase